MARQRSSKKKDSSSSQATSTAGKNKVYRRVRHSPSRRYLAHLQDRPNGPLSLQEALEKLKQFDSTKFDQSVEVAISLGIDPKQADQNVRGSISLPKGIGKTKRVIAFCEGELAEQAKQAGAVAVGGEELAKRISEGWMEFDVAVAHPSAMRYVGRLGKLLGPRGLMPSPKSGTVTADVATAVREYSAGKVEFRNDRGGNIHVVVGKLSFPVEDLKANVVALVDYVRRLKPASTRGTYIRKVALSATMSPSVEVEPSSIDGG